MIFRQPYNNRGIYFLAILCLLLIPLSIAYADYPEIKSFTNDDIFYVQLESEIEHYYTMSKKNSLWIPDVTIYKYNPKQNADLYMIAAKANIPYDTLVTINRTPSPGGFNALRTILIPSAPGIFVPFSPQTDLEKLMCSWRFKDAEPPMYNNIILNGILQKFVFFHGQRFSSVERAFFLDIFFRFPIPYGKVSSGFGTRQSPFSGHPEIHNGIDIAVPLGTDVFATREGKVTKTGADPTYGNYILLTHPGEYQSFYGHLDKILVLSGQSVSSGSIIGKVGTSGRSTGPHLHFEIRKNGVQIDPSSHIRQIEK